MIFMQKKSFLLGLDNLGANWYFVGMHGQMPTSEPNMSVEDLIKSGVCLFEASSVIRNDNHLKFYNVSGLVPYVGVSEELTSNGYRVHTQNIDGVNGLPNSAYVKFLEQDLSTVVAEGESITYNLGHTVELSELVFDAPSAIVALRVEALVEGSWTFIADVAGVTRTSVDSSQVTAKIRLTNISGAAQSVYNCLEVYANSRPVDHPAADTITWCAMIPKDPSAISDTYGTDFPFGWLPCSGPNDGAMLILNDANPGFGETVRLLYLTLQPAVLEF